VHFDHSAANGNPDAAGATATRRHGTAAARTARYGALPVAG